MNDVQNLTVGELRAFLAQLETVKEVTAETKIFLDTGWDSIQEIAPDALSIEQARPFEITDPLSGEVFGGYRLAEKADPSQADGPSETVLVIRNLY